MQDMYHTVLCLASTVLPNMNRRQAQELLSVFLSMLLNLKLYALDQPNNAHTAPAA